MQIRALSNSKPVFASAATKGENYFCPECCSTLRLRGGQRRQLHFFHLKAHRSCRQHQKGPEHLNLQLHIHSLFPESQMERPFPSIGRIADVACEKTKRIFEIQVSPITAEEVRARCVDYESLGYEVIWILHDKRFNKRLLSSAELFLKERRRYFSNMNPAGKGMIYDQLEEIIGIRRQKRGPPLMVDLRSCLAGGRLKPIFTEKKASTHPIKSFYHRVFSLLLQKIG